MDESRQRAQQLLSLLKQSKILSKQKCYDDTDETEDMSVEKKGKRLAKLINNNKNKQELRTATTI